MQYGAPTKPEGQGTTVLASTLYIHLPATPTLLVSRIEVALIPETGGTTLLGGSGATIAILTTFINKYYAILSPWNTCSVVFEGMI